MIYEWIFLKNPSFTAEESNRYYLSKFSNGIALDHKSIRDIKQIIKLRNNLEQTFHDRLDKIKDDEGKEFLEYKLSYSNNTDEIRFFCNSEMKNNLRDDNIKQWYFDFTYYCCPTNRSNYKNVGVLVGEDCRNGSLSLGFLTVSKKESERTIDLIFHLVKLINPNFNPDYIVCDFSKSILKSLDKLFTSRIIGCFFHFSQALWRKANSIGLKSNLYCKIIKS